jgi:hypothetical protein
VAPFVPFAPKDLVPLREIVTIPPHQCVHDFRIPKRG